MSPMLQQCIVWSTLPSLVIWVLWKARCKCVFQKVKQNVVELVKDIWLMLLHTLRGQYEAITGEPEVVIRKQQQILRNLEKGRGLHLLW